MSNALTPNQVTFHQLTEQSMASRWSELDCLSSDQEWMSWGKSSYTLNMPRKWEFSRLAYSGESLVGYCLCSVRGGLLWVHRLVVEGASRGRGIGAAIVREMLTLVESAGLLGIMLKTPTGNQRALKFYADVGFREVAKENEYVTLLCNLQGRLAVGVHQPNYLPWLGYFYKMSISNVFIFLDDVVFPTRSYVNRNKICINGEAKWLTVPTGRSYEADINESFPAGSDWVKKHLSTLKMVYGRAPFFNQYFPDIEAVLSSNSHRDFSGLNISLIKYVASKIGIDCVFLRSSEMDVGEKSDVRLALLVEKIGGQVYISGSGGANYQSESTFEERSIRLIYSNFKAENYAQNSKEFIPGLGVLDAMFNVGAEEIALMFKRNEFNRFP